MVAVPVNPEVLVWAREERRLDRKAAAELLGISPHELYSFEIGENLPSLTMLRRIAEKYEITFGALLMPQPLPRSTRPVINDFRTHGGAAPEIGHQLMVELEDVNQLIDGLVELRDADPVPFTERELPRLLLSDSIPIVAVSERQRVGVTVLEQIGWDSPSHGFQRWRSVIENQGVFVYLLDLGDATNCRGFTILDDRHMPVIVINNDETEPGPRAFTLLHEYAHLLLRRPGITDERGESGEERFCNQFAAHFLMPRLEFSRTAAPLRSPDGSWSDAAINRISATFKVSRTATAFHLEDVGLAEQGFGSRIWQRSLRAARRPGGPAYSWERKQLNKLGGRHVSIVLEALDQGRINKIDANELLGVKPPSFAALRDEASAHRAAYGASR